MADVAYVLNTNQLVVSGLREHRTGAFINDAAVTLTVRDSNGAPVAGVAWPVAAQYVAASEGDYVAIIPHTAEFVAKQRYTAHVDVDAGVDRVANWQRTFKPEVRS